MTSRTRPHWLMIAMGLVVLATTAESSAAPKFKVTRCKTDNDCAGTKVCVKNTCEEPAGAAPAACKADADCPGNQVCSQNKCAEPGGGAAAPAPAPAPAPAYAPPPAPAPAAGPAYAPPPPPAPAPAAPASCRTDTECPGNLVCIQNVCAQPGAPAAAPGAAPAPQPYYAQPGNAQPQPGPGAPAAAASDVEGPVTPGGSIAGLLGYGLSGDSDVPYRIGLGIRGGYTLPMHLYFGGTFIYHLGRSEGGGSMKLFYLAGEVGYSIAAGPMELRPYAGIGMANVMTSYDLGMGISGSDSTSKIVFWPGFLALYPFGKGFVGGDLRYVIMNDVPGPGTGNSIGFFFTGGMHF